MSARRRKPKTEKVELQMTSMIDVVFLLLAVFTTVHLTLLCNAIRSMLFASSFMSFAKLRLILLFRIK
jgi:biopolymer transport protein ExbD